MSKMLGLDVIVVDAKTGDVVSWPVTSGIQAPAMYELAANFLPGMPAEEIEKAYGAYMSDDPAPAQMIQALPTAPGSVIHHSNYGLLVLDEKAQWGSYEVAMLGYELKTDNLYGWTWSLVFDAGVTS